MILSSFLKLKYLPLFLFTVLSGHTARGVDFTGDPSLDDGWVFHGNSLQSSFYVRGSGNLAFDSYTTAFFITERSHFSLTDHDQAAYLPYYETAHWTKADARPWKEGELVIGIGGVFRSVTASQAGWDTFSGAAVNGSLEGENRFRLQAKIGTADATWTSSLLAPGNGNGSGSTGSGGDAAFLVRTSGWYDLATWEAFDSTLMGLQRASHLSHSAISVDTARVIWRWDSEAQRVGSWELLLNLSLMEADLLASGYTGAMPGALGNQVIGSVQIGSGASTDMLFSIEEPLSSAEKGVDPLSVPEPSMLALSLLAIAIGLKWRPQPRPVSF